MTGLQAALDAKADTVHVHTIANVVGLQNSLDGKADTVDLAAKADVADLTAKANVADVYTKIQTYTKTEVDAIASGITEGGGTVVQDNLTSISTTAALSANQGRVLNETKADAADLAAKADVADLTAKADVADLAAKANVADVYTKIQTYTKTEVDAIASGITEGGGTVVEDNLISTNPIYALSANQGRILNETKAAIDHNHDANYAAIVHNHAIADVTNLQTALDGKAAIVHDHEILDVTGLQTALDSKADDADLAAKADVVHVHAIADVTNLQTALDGKADDADLAAKADAIHVHTIADVTGLQTALDGKADDADLAAKADAATVYTKIETYTKTEVDAIASGITEGGGTIVQDNLTSVSTTAALSANQGRVLNETKADAADLAAKADVADLAAKADVIHTHLWVDITDKPTTFTPAAHVHTIANVTGLQTALDGKADDADLAQKQILFILIYGQILQTNLQHLHLLHMIILS